MSEDGECNMDYKELYEELFELSGKINIAFIDVLKALTTEYKRLLKINKKLSNENSKIKLETKKPNRGKA